MEDALVAARFFDPASARACRNLVIVAGHAVLREGGHPAREEDWVLLDYQQGETPFYTEHAACGVHAAAHDEEALLVFAGGQSRREAGPRSEGQSYFALAAHNGWFGHPEVATRSTTEEFSRDSFENLLLSICRFRECTGAYPQQVSFVSWAFKQKRFQLHRDAIGWPAERFSYLGPNNPRQLEQALRAEALTEAHYQDDPYSSGPYLAEKRAARNPFLRRHGYLETCPELRALMEHRGPEWFTGPLPWH